MFLVRLHKSPDVQLVSASAPGKRASAYAGALRYVRFELRLGSCWSWWWCLGSTKKVFFFFWGGGGGC